MDVRKRLISLLVLVFVLVFAWLIFQRNNSKPIIYSNFGTNIPLDYPVLGIDVSHHQGAINWPTTAEMEIDGDSVQFVYIKATEGLTFRDDKKDDNVDGARLEGLKYGLYHFYMPGKSAKAQADFFAENISGDESTLAPALDIEVSGDLTNAELADSILVFLDRVEKKLGMRPIVYTYENFFKENLDGGKAANEKYWVASYRRECRLMERDNFLVWQFSESGTVSGIAQSVDLNIAKESFFEECGKKKE